MKTNEAPEKLYFPIDDALETYARKDSDEEIEYTRTDSFIEKTTKWFYDNCANYMVYNLAKAQAVFDIEQMIEDYKKEMKI